MQEMWEKFVHLASAAAVTCLMRANVGQIVRTGEGARLLQGMLDTAIEVARRNGHPPGEEFVASYRALFAASAPTDRQSVVSGKGVSVSVNHGGRRFIETQQ